MTKNSYYQDIQDAIAIYARDILAAGEKEERERILKLLEEYYWVGDKSEYGLSRLIAFIKGENK